MVQHSPPCPALDGNLFAPVVLNGKKYSQEDHAAGESLSTLIWSAVFIALARS